ncbi:transcription termination factor 4, mitochondrial [Phyllopteryx taeniolatus]|uniref:transcription termination factor 4, mitochondrial n=1 Tax=Phyllopteryx taeniolatus TaxID=161469 RepID=UPI002AD57169|nr:transcription termination factor 4, mitochondrial [Phyllopteryx taeniolatus]
MNARLAARQVLCMLRRTPSSAFSPLHSGSKLQCRLLRSASSNPLPGVANNDLGSPQRQTAPELSLPCLLDMGFTHSQAEDIYESVCKARGGSAAKHCLSTLTLLFMLGLNPSSVMKLLTKCPDLYTVKESLLQQRISSLRKLGLVEGSLQRLVAHYPAILTVPVKTLKQLTMFLREKCLFTVQQVTDILRDSPAVVHQERAQLEYKFQYVYFRMGIKQAEMVKHRLFRSTLEEVRWRHSFLERRGLYQTPDKKGQTLVVNPKLDRVLNVDLDTFLANAANASAEEYDVFRRLLAREWQEEERHYGDESADDDDDNEEDEDEMEGKDSYRKRKRK